MSTIRNYTSGVAAETTIARIEFKLASVKATGIMKMLGMAKHWANQIELDWEPIHKDATSSDYEHLLQVLDKHFGDYVVFYR